MKYYFNNKKLSLHINNLSLEEEQRHLKNYKESKCKVSQEALIRSHIKLIYKYINNSNFSYSYFDDLVAEGTIGLMVALEKFDLDKECRFSTYASWWIKSHINDFILQTWNIVSISSSAKNKKFFYNISKAMQRLHISSTNNISEDKKRMLAKELDITVKDLENLISKFNNTMSINQDDSNSMDIECPSNEHLQFLEREEVQDIMKVARDVINTLSSRDKDIIENRFFADKKLTLLDLANRWGISQERVRQVENKVINVIKAKCNVDNINLDAM